MGNASDDGLGSCGGDAAAWIDSAAESDLVSRMRRIDRICDRYEAALRAGEEPAVDRYLTELPEADRELAQRELRRMASVYAEKKETPPQTLVLEVIGNETPSRRLERREPTTIVIGTSPDAHLRIDGDASAGRVHCCLIWEPPRCRILDLGSAAETLVNGRTVRESMVEDGDLVVVGRTEIRVSLHPHGVTVPVQGPTASAQPAVLAAAEQTVDYLPPSAPGPRPPLVSAAVPGYELLRELGRGGMGVVYEARHKASGEPAAVKVIIPPQRAGNRAVQLFLREASIQSQMRHERIVRFREIGMAAGQLFLATELVPAIDVKNCLVNRQTPEQIQVCCDVVCQVLEALEYAHGLGFVHRDIKPSNILVYMDGGKFQAKLADFGLAKQFEHAGFSDLTRSREARGTLAYMSPEQFDDPRFAKPACDLFSTGATLYYLLSGRHPYEVQESGLQIQAIRAGRLVPLALRRPDLPSGLSEAISQALARSPRERHQSAAAMRAAILPYAQRGSVPTRPPGAALSADGLESGRQRRIRPLHWIAEFGRRMANPREPEASD